MSITDRSPLNVVTFSQRILCRKVNRRVFYIDICYGLFPVCAVALSVTFQGSHCHNAACWLGLSLLLALSFVELPREIADIDPPKSFMGEKLLQTSLVSGVGFQVKRGFKSNHMPSKNSPNPYPSASHNVVTRILDGAPTSEQRPLAGAPFTTQP